VGGGYHKRVRADRVARKRCPNCGTVVYRSGRKR
jgi:predicted RNA-binding Zn-ribbon protein involved in translation (DUF1610 family)